MRLFDIPACAVPAAAEPPFPAGGIGGGHFVWDDQGRFRRWRLHPGVPEVDVAATHDRFYLWFRPRGEASTCMPLEGDAIAETHRLFPLTWRRYALNPRPSTLNLPILESVSFSPLLPTTDYERSLPVHVVAFRAHNPTDREMELSLLLMWECGWPEPCTDTVYDFQHDNLCLTGSLGSADSANRQGIAVPDLHYAGVYEQGIQPWGDADEAEAELREQGELDELADRGEPKGAVAWLKFKLRPGETKEAPFILAWHFPVYESGPAAGLPRYYTQYLGRYRPDNAIVWLAEQAVQHFGAETANYKYWLQAIRDWQDASALGSRLNGLSELLRADAAWTEERGLEAAGLSAHERKRLEEAGLSEVWGDLLLSSRG